MNILNRLCTINLPLFATVLIGALLQGTTANADDLQDATQLFQQGQQAQALDKVNNYLLNNKPLNKPKDAKGRFLKGLIFTGQNKTADAIQVFSDLTRDFPELPEPYNNLAVLYASQGQYDKAKAALELAIRSHPNFVTAHENLGDIYVKMASQAYERALKLDSSNTATQAKLAMIKDMFSDKPHNKYGAQQNPATKPVAESDKVVMPMMTPKANAPLAATPATADTAPGSPAAAKQAVQDAVEGWAAAWSSKNAHKYLSYYATDFKTPDGESRSSWMSTRKESINHPKHIEVKLSSVSVDLTDSTHATVKLHQDYHADTVRTSVGKTLLMVKSGNSWLIQEERVN